MLPGGAPFTCLTRGFAMRTVIFVRVTPDTQNPEDADSQERRVRARLDSLSVPHDDALVLNGTDFGADYRFLLWLIRQRGIGILAMTSIDRCDHDPDAIRPARDLLAQGGRVITLRQDTSGNQGPNLANL
jgi:hypothetical protein